MSDVKNCLFCGRDTTAISGYCYRCVGKGQQMPYEIKDRHIFQLDGENATELDSRRIREDNYSEEAMGPGKPRVHIQTGKEETRHFNLMRRIYE